MSAGSSYSTTFCVAYKRYVLNFFVILSVVGFLSTEALTAIPPQVSDSTPTLIPPRMNTTFPGKFYLKCTCNSFQQVYLKKS